jgi:hypothetical protein
VKSAQKVNYCFMPNLRLVLAPTLRADFLEPDALKAGAFKRPTTDASKYRHIST